MIQICKMLHHQLHFYITNTADFLFFISENDSVNFLSVSKNVNYLENGLDSIYKSLAKLTLNRLANVPTKFDMNCLVSFEVIQISRF